MFGGIFMAKYSFEFKLKVVKDYLAREGGADYLATKYGIPSSSKIKEWIKAYNAFGDAGLQRSREKKVYTFEFKMYVVELYLTTEISYQELALSVGMNNPSLLAKWVNDFRIAGPNALKPKQKGRPSLKKPKPTISKENGFSDSNAEYVKQLEDELLKLRIENAYLKELRRLRLEETPRNKKRE